jgi:uncharacterized protein (DUF4415 family)
MKLKNPLSADELERQIAAASNVKDEEINTSDIQPLTDDSFKNAIFNPYYKPVKKQLTVRLDAVLIEWLKGQGKGYQTRLNDILKKAMIDDLKHN